MKSGKESYLLSPKARGDTKPLLESLIMGISLPYHIKVCEDILLESTPLKIIIISQKISTHISSPKTYLPAIQCSAKR